MEVSAENVFVVAAGLDEEAAVQVSGEGPGEMEGLDDDEVCAALREVGSGAATNSTGGGWQRVEQTFFWARRRWRLDVATDFGRCFRTSCEVRPGQVEKKPASMAAHHVLVEGLKAAWWRYVTRSVAFRMAYALQQYAAVPGWVERSGRGAWTGLAAGREKGPRGVR